MRRWGYRVKRRIWGERLGDVYVVRRKIRKISDGAWSEEFGVG